MNTLEWPEISGFSQYARLLHLPIRASFTGRSLRSVADEMGQPRALDVRLAAHEFRLFSRTDPRFRSCCCRLRTMGADALRHLFNHGRRNGSNAFRKASAQTSLVRGPDRQLAGLHSPRLRGFLQLHPLARFNRFRQQVDSNFYLLNAEKSAKTSDTMSVRRSKRLRTHASVPRTIVPQDVSPLAGRFFSTCQIS